MRIRTRKNLAMKNVCITFLFLLPLILFGAYAGFCVYILNDVFSFSLNLAPLNTQYFYKLDNILGNFTYLENIAYKYDYQMKKWHMPTNITVDVTFTNNKCI